MAATILATHVSPALTDLNGHPRIEVGLHPNFNPWLEPGARGDGRIDWRADPGPCCA